MKSLLFCLLVMLSTGCSYKSYTSKVGKSTHVTGEEKLVTIATSPENNIVTSASLGELMFTVEKRGKGGEIFITHSPSTDLGFPNTNKWQHTHNYNDGVSGTLKVYSHPDFYHGNIGVILNRNGTTYSEKPLVQLSGVKEGRRWQVSGSGNFFKAANILLESWGLRYGGENDGVYVFEILDRRDANVTQVIQRLEITSDKFLEGLFVRGVMLKGLALDDKGLIKYVIKSYPNEKH
ncbi:hypothetical protein [Kangiella taiwanensis]|uniref:Lipoprotein n=1 Tax=Kangiella taiwanensis TaxID=1079179 RepID=A0ABP8HW21_9GAMM|nr:hypothetical protein [Kangiella taiwanensis]